MIASVALQSSGPPPAEHPYVAIGIVSSTAIRTIALAKCDSAPRPRAPPSCFAVVSATGGQAMAPIRIAREREKDLASMAAHGFDQQARDSYISPTLAVRNSTDDRLSDGRSRARRTRRGDPLARWICSILQGRAPARARRLSGFGDGASSSSATPRSMARQSTPISGAVSRSPVTPKLIPPS